LLERDGCDLRALPLLERKRQGTCISQTAAKVARHMDAMLAAR